MDRLLVWYNPNTDSFYNKWCKCYSAHEGDVNQFGHVLVNIFEADHFLDSEPFLRRGLSLSDNVKLIRNFGRYNPYLKYYNHFTFFDLLYYSD